MQLTEEQKATFDKYQKLTYYLIQNKFGVKGSDSNFEFLKSIADDALISAILTYNPNKNASLTTYAARCIQNALYSYIKRSAAHNGGIKTLKLDDDPKLFMVEDPRRFEDDLTSSEYEQHMMTLAHSRLLQESPEDQVLFNRYLLGETEAAIARSLGVSRQMVSRRIIKLKNLIKAEVLDNQYNQL